MIYASQIYDTVLSWARKDKRGLSFSPQEYNDIAIGINQRIYRLNYADFESSKLSIDETGSFKVIGYPAHPINLDANGIGALPADYMHLVGDPYYFYTSGDGKYVSARRKIDLITSLEFGQREMDYYTKSSVLYPTAFAGFGVTSDDMSLYVNPVSCTPIYVDYLRKVVVPYLDFYVNDTTLEITYLPQTATAISLPLGYTAPQVIKNGTVLRTETTGASSISSFTVDWDWHDHDVPQIINLILGAIGVQLPDAGLVQVSETDLPIIEKA